MPHPVGRPMVRAAILLLGMLFGPGLPATAQVSVGVGVGLPGVSIGINVPYFPSLVPVPGYPVYYDPRLNLNLFFYDGAYWVFTGDNWYASSWYDGPWDLIGPQFVPDFLLRVPVRYYRRPPPWFMGWSGAAAPRWGEHWGRDWGERRPGWDHWNRAAVPPRAPLPTYQRRYSQRNYPNIDQQRALRDRRYRYDPREDAPRRNLEQQRGHERESNLYRGGRQGPGTPPRRTGKPPN